MNYITTPTFITELPLRVTPKQESTILVRLEFARQLYNACLGESLRRLSLMRQSKVYQSACYIPRDDNLKQERRQAFAEARTRYNFREYDLHVFAATIQIGWIGSSVVQAVASRAFRAAGQYSFGKRGKPRFKGPGQMDSLEGKQNTVLRWNGKEALWGGLVLPAIFPKDGRKGNDVIVHGLNARVKYVRLVRKKMHGKNRFFVQIVCEGQPYQKSRNPIGEGVVGIDIGPSTIAIVAPTAKQAELRQFCSELRNEQKKIRLLQRKLDRQRRANNSHNYNEKGTVKKGEKQWAKSKNYEGTRKRLFELHRKLAARRKSLHGQLVNHIFSFGNDIRLEKLSYRAFQRMFGKSVGMRAPGMFVSLLKRKAASAGVGVTEFPTQSTKLSQACLCGAEKKKPLSRRWHVCACGLVAQRDLFSAFLASCVEEEKLNAELARKIWSSGMDVCLRAALSEVKPAIGGEFPASFGLSRSQSGSPVKVCVKAEDNRGVVASESQRREPGKACSVRRPPRL
jgi:putative transposase